MTAPPLPDNFRRSDSCWVDIAVAAAAPPLTLVGVLCLAEWGLAGWMAGAAIGTIVAALLLASSPTVLERCTATAIGAVLLGVMLLALKRVTGLSNAESLQAASVVASVWLLAAALVSIGRSVRWPPCMAGGVALSFVFAWLFWPIWLRAAPPLLVAVHPLLALNGVLSARLGFWTEQPVFYQITSLGQDVPFQLPTTPWACVGAQAGVAMVMLTIPVLWDRR